MRTSLFFFCLILFCFFLFLPRSLAANNSGIFISEVMWNGSPSSSADEWLELYNASDEIVDIGGYCLFDEVKGQEILKITEGQIPAKGNFLISNNNLDHSFSGGESVLNITPDIVDSSLSISNSTLQIALYDNSGQRLDSVGDGGQPFFYDFKKSSIYRVDFDAPGSEPAAWSVYQNDPAGQCEAAKNVDLDQLDQPKICATPEVSGRPIINALSLSQTKFEIGKDIKFKIDFDVFDPNNDLVGFKIIDSGGKFEKFYDLAMRDISVGSFYFCPDFQIVFFDEKGLSVQKNIYISCYQRSADIWISEVLPHPKQIDFDGDGVLSSSDEYIELVNSGTGPVNIEGWYIEDESGKKYVFRDVEIEPLGYLVIFKSDSGISINDAGEKIRLFLPSGELIEEITIKPSTSKYDISYSKWGDSWYWSKIATPGTENIINEIGSSNNPSTEQISESQNKEVKIKARVISVERSVFSVEYEESTIDVVNLSEDTPGVGQMVTISGQITGGKYFKMFANSIIVNDDYDSGQNQGPDATSLAMGSSSILTFTTTKKTKIVKTIRSKNIAAALNEIGAGGSAIDSLKISHYMVYLSGIFSFFITILIYEICCRE